MAITLRYDPAAAHKLLPAESMRADRNRLLAARDEVMRDVSLLDSGAAIPADKPTHGGRRLIGINPYGQPGVEAYKKNMTSILASR